MQIYVVHWFDIKVYGPHREIVEELYWSGMKWDLRIKYDWYFKYRAALLQVKYPKLKVETTWGNEPAVGKSLEEIRQSRIRGKKSKITECKNNLQKAKETWTELFPIEDDPLYQKAVAKINRLEMDLLTL